ncbi:MAG: hypothetical protein A2W03_11155 [Candidatus Aminicenantes bacterium RBG_16_63_16]|nr:MAG: hypothetical protein A2W03_11155 [Candidatus Aminicenantes bacterium RBG_16_63_16]
MSNLTLMVLAAGIGRRYLGLKQVEPVGPSGETMLDYAVHDGLRAGFGRLVFVIRKEIEAVFRRSIGNFWESRAPLSYVYQELDGALPAGFIVPPDRRKPWGTAHAVLLCRDTVGTPFAAINADDFYGPGAFRALGEWLRSLPATAPAAGDEFGFVGYPLKKTLSEHGHVSRGVCTLDGEGYLREVVERVKVEKAGDGARAQIGPGRWQSLTGDEVASMNFWGFTPHIFPLLDSGFAEFLKRCGSDPDAEFYLSSAVNDMITSGKARVKHIPTRETWFGLTYPGDIASVRSWIRELVEHGVYPQDLRGRGGRDRV